MSNQIVREVIRDFERRKDKAEALRISRRNDIYNAAPRLKEIDERLVVMGMEMSKAVLSGGDAAAFAEELARESDTLNREKARIRLELPFPADYLDSVYTCMDCKDTGYLRKDGMPVRCACYGRRVVEELYRFSNIGSVLHKENFDNFDMSLFSNEIDEKTGVSPRDAMIQHLNTATGFVDNFDEGFDNLLLMGYSGLGKTFLCNCIAKALLDQGRSVIYVTSPQMFKMVETVRFNRDDEDERADMYLDMLPICDLLIIDDLGTEVTTSVTTSALFDIMNARHFNRKHTIISTNLDLTMIKNIYSDRIISRLFGTYTMCRLCGDDLRIKKRFGR